MVKLRLTLKAMDNQGFILVTVMWLIALLSMVAIGGLILSSTEYKNSLGHVKAKQAYYLAEAGLEEGLHLLRNNPAQQVSLSHNLETGTIIVKQQGGIAEQIALESIGASGKIKKKLNLAIEFTFLDRARPIQVELADLQLSSPEAPLEIAQNIFCGGDLSLQDNYGIKGNVYCLGTIELAQGSFIEGDVYSYNGLSLRGDAFIKGQIYLKNMDDLVVETSAFIEGKIKQWDGQAPLGILKLK